MAISHGPCTNAHNFKFLGASPILSELIFGNLDIAPYTITKFTNLEYGTEEYTGIILFNSLRVKGNKDKNLRTCLNLAETLIPAIPDNHYLDTRASQQKLVDVFTTEWNDIKSHEHFRKVILNRQEISWEQDESSDFYGGRSTDILTNKDKIDLISIEKLTAHEAVALLIETGRILPETWIQKSKVPIVELIIAFAKQGNVTHRSMNKMISELNNTNPGIAGAVDPSSIRLIWNTFSTKLDDSIAEELFVKWEGMLPPGAERFRWTIQQAAGVGLTSISSIAKALTAFPDFNWYKISRLYPKETNSVKSALLKVSKNKYYGFKRDLGVVKTTNYPSYTYIAVKMLNEINGDLTLQLEEEMSERDFELCEMEQRELKLERRIRELRSGPPKVNVLEKKEHLVEENRGLKRDKP